MEDARGTIGIINPAAPHLRGGNRVTAMRWSAILRSLGWRVFVEQSWSGRDCDLLVALHARHSNDSVARFNSERPNRPIVVAGTGTDLYTDVEDSGEVLDSLQRATRIVVLQALAVSALPEEVRSKSKIIHQSVLHPPGRKAAQRDFFEVCVIAHLRPVKDPLRAALAARLLPESSRIRVTHIGSVIDERMRSDLDNEIAGNPRFHYMGELLRQEALDVLARSRVLVNTSRHEGGANVISEALAIPVPILATRIPGSLGLLEEDYPGVFDVGDTEGLARLFERVESDGAFLAELERRCRERSPMTDPELERRSWGELLAELVGTNSDHSPTVG